jgi:hypothetical protein
MKKIFYIKTVLSLMSIALLSSCLRDTQYNVDFSKTTPLVELPGAANVSGNAGPFESASFKISGTATPYNVPVNIAAPKALGSATTVKLSVDQAALDAYNTANSTSYTLLPAADYSSTLSVTIPAGKNLGNVVINLNTSLIDPSQSYVLPLTITSGGGIQISNYKTILFNFAVKNIYDGEYTVTGTMNDSAVAADVGNYPFDIDLVTAGANSNYMFDTHFGGPAHEIVGSGALSYYGSFAPQFTFSGNAVTSVINAYGQPAANGRSARLDATGVNTLTGTPGTAGFKIQVSYVLVAAGVDRTFFNETFTYVGP